MALDERAFFTERPEQRVARYGCPKCRRTNDYTVRWVRRTKKDRLPPGADERDRAKFAKLRDHLIRVDDELVCKSCQRKFEIPSMHSMMFLDQLEGLPQVDDDDEDDLPAAPRAAAPAPAGPQTRPVPPPPQGRSPQQDQARGPQGQAGGRIPHGGPSPQRGQQPAQGQARGSQHGQGQGRGSQHGGQPARGPHQGQGARGPQGPGQRPGPPSGGRDRDGNRAPGYQGPGDNRPAQPRRGPPRARGWFQGE